MFLLVRLSEELWRRARWRWLKRGQVEWNMLSMERVSTRPWENSLAKREARTAMVIHQIIHAISKQSNQTSQRMTRRNELNQSSLFVRPYVDCWLNHRPLCVSMIAYSMHRCIRTELLTAWIPGGRDALQTIIGSIRMCIYPHPKPPKPNSWLVPFGTSRFHGGGKSREVVAWEREKREKE